MIRILTLLATRLMAVLGNLRVPVFLRTTVWKTYGRFYGVRFEEMAEPDLAAYPSFQAFFTRRLREGVRPIHTAPGTWVSPVDALWLSHVTPKEDVFHPVKGNLHSLRELLDHEAAAMACREGFVSTFYLRPGDYHRIHAPCDMTLKQVRMLPGRLLPVNNSGQRVPGLFARNERWVIEAETPEGPLWMLWVGALMVGSVQGLHPALRGLPRRSGHLKLDDATAGRGDELGTFRFGSTVMLVAPHRAAPLAEPPCEIRVGQPILNWETPS